MFWDSMCKCLGFCRRFYDTCNRAATRVPEMFLMFWQTRPVRSRVGPAGGTSHREPARGAAPQTKLRSDQIDAPHPDLLIIVDAEADIAGQLDVFNLAVEADAVLI